MTIQVDNIQSSNHQAVNVFIKPEHDYPTPSAGWDGVTFPSIPTKVKQFVITTSVGALGTRVVTDTKSVKPLQNIRFILPSSDDSPLMETTLERYKRLRSDIVAAGIPLLSDEELRAEIRDRKGVREP